MRINRRKEKSMKGKSMKGITGIIQLFSLLMLLTFYGCGDVRELPTEKVVTIYNSNMEATNKMGMLDTMYVELGGLKPNEMHTIEALDPEGNVISEMTQISDEEGVISAAPLWYDVGLKKADSRPDIGGSLSLRAFNIHVTGPDTDYTEPFYIVYSTNNVGEQPRSVVWASYSSAAGWGLENAFDETGTVDADGNAGKTKVYVEAKNIPGSVSGSGVTAVDIYVLPTKGAANLWTDGESLTDNFVVRKLNIDVSLNASTGANDLAPTLLWDLNDPATSLINPAEENNSYDIILDVNQNGLFDIGEDVNNDGITDRYIDGIDGQGVVGFIVANTEANEFFVSITDENGNNVDVVEDGQLNGSQLYIAMDNLPPSTTPVIHLYNRGTTDDVFTAFTTTVTLANFSTHYLPYVSSEIFVDTTGVTNLNRLPGNVTQPAVTSYDLFIDMNDNGTFDEGTDYKKDSAVKVIHPPTAVFTTDGTNDTVIFDETGTDPGSTAVRLRTVSLGAAAVANLTVYVVPTRAAGWSDGALISNFTVGKSVTTDGTGNIADHTLIWDLDASPALKNPTSSNNTYDVLIDLDNDGIYDAASDVLGRQAFVVRDTAANSLPNVQYANIASGGKFSRSSKGYKIYTDFDYRDSFVSNGRDTKRIGNQRGSAGGGYGIKAIWNPYIKDSRNKSYVPAGTQSLYRGNRVDVYIVDATKANLGDYATAVLGEGDFVDVSGGKNRLPVQFGCYNGAGQQNIWVPNFAVGQYYVIVDVNRDGRITEGLDLIDATKKDGTTIREDSSVVGFSVYQ